MIDALLERDLIPDALIRFGIRRLLAGRLREENKGSPQAQKAHLLHWVEAMKKSPIAVETDAANREHYEVPTRFFQLSLGPRLKYSSGYWPQPGTTFKEN